MGIPRASTDRAFSYVPRCCVDMYFDCFPCFCRPASSRCDGMLRLSIFSVLHLFVLVPMVLNAPFLSVLGLSGMKGPNSPCPFLRFIHVSSQYWQAHSCLARLTETSVRRASLALAPDHLLTSGTAPNPQKSILRFSRCLRSVGLSLAPESLGEMVSVLDAYGDGLIPITPVLEFLRREAGISPEGGDMQQQV